MSDTRTIHEVEITVTDVSGARHTEHAEVKTQSADVVGAASEVLEAYTAHHGKETVRFVDDAR